MRRLVSIFVPIAVLAGLVLAGCGRHADSIVGAWKGKDIMTGSEKTVELNPDGTYTESLMMSVSGGPGFETWATTTEGNYVYDGTMLKTTAITASGVRQGDGKRWTRRWPHPITVPAKVHLSGNELSLDFDPDKREGTPIVETWSRS